MYKSPRCDVEWKKSVIKNSYILYVVTGNGHTVFATPLKRKQSIYSSLEYQLLLWLALTHRLWGKWHCVTSQHWAAEACSSHPLGTWMPRDKAQDALLDTCNPTDGQQKPADIYLGPVRSQNTKLGCQMTAAICMTQGGTNRRTAQLSLSQTGDKELWASRMVVVLNN